MSAESGRRRRAHMRAHREDISVGKRLNDEKDRAAQPLPDLLYWCLNGYHALCSNIHANCVCGCHRGHERQDAGPND